MQRKLIIFKELIIIYIALFILILVAVFNIIKQTKILTRIIETIAIINMFI